VIDDMNKVLTVAQAAAEATSQLVVPLFYVIGAEIAAMIVAVGVVWKWLTSAINTKVKVAVTFEMSDYEERQIKIMEDVAFIKGKMSNE
jgi:hypothetical protein